MELKGQAEMIGTKLDQILEDEPGYFQVEVSIRPANNIKVYVDADGGAAIDRLSMINRKLYKWLEENMFPDGDFSLEVSSPGLDEPLKLDRQYVKNIGRFVEVLLTDGVKKEGKLKEVREDEILLEEYKGKEKKKETIQHSILKKNIKSTKIQIKF